MLFLFINTYITLNYKIFRRCILNFSGLGFRPLPPQDNIDSTLIWFTHGSGREWNHWVESLGHFLDGMYKYYYFMHYTDYIMSLTLFLPVSNDTFYHFYL